MNELGLLNTIKGLLTDATWKNSANPIFASGSIILCTADQSVALEKLRCPFALIRPDSGTNDPDDPDIVYQRFVITVGIHVAGSNMGEFLVTGRGDTTSSSQTAGIPEVGAQMTTQLVYLLKNTSGIIVKSVAHSRVAQTTDERSREIAYRDYIFEAVIASD